MVFFNITRGKALITLYQLSLFDKLFLQQHITVVYDHLEDKKLYCCEKVKIRKGSKLILLEWITHAGLATV